MSVVLSTRNPHKVREFAGLLDGLDVRPLPTTSSFRPRRGRRSPTTR